MEPADIERIAQSVLREYGMPLKVHALSVDRAGKCTIEFTNPGFKSSTLSVAIWCDAKASPHGVRDSLINALDAGE